MGQGAAGKGCEPIGVIHHTVNAGPGFELAEKGNLEILMHVRTGLWLATIAKLLAQPWAMEIRLR